MSTLALFQRFQRCDRGSAGVEFSFVGLILLLAALGTVELGRGLNVRNQLSQAIDYGARKLLVDKTISDSALEASTRPLDQNRFAERQ